MRKLTPSKLRQRGMDILVRELGHADAIRFMRHFSKGSGDYTKDRKAMLAGATLEGLLESSAKRVKAAKAASNVRRARKESSTKTSPARKLPKMSKKERLEYEAEIRLERAEVFPAWMERHFEQSRKASQMIAAKRGKSLKVFKGLDMKGI